eukprot:COSAG02_NODE_1492_length_12334_cov_29.721945_10_plen_153_part_00
MGFGLVHAWAVTAQRRVPESYDTPGIRSVPSARSNLIHLLQRNTRGITTVPVPEKVAWERPAGSEDGEACPGVHLWSQEWPIGDDCSIHTLIDIVQLYGKYCGQARRRTGVSILVRCDACDRRQVPSVGDAKSCVRPNPAPGLLKMRSTPKS